MPNRSIMRVRSLALLLPGLILGLWSDGAHAQENPAHAHIGHVLDGFGQTPDGEGLLPTALAEAEVARQHAGFAAGDLENLDAMKMHAEHVLHAVDPEAIDGGPGHGFGVKRAAEGIAQHVQLAADSDGASDNVQTHAAHVAASARTVAQRADEIVAVVEQILAAESAGEAAPLVEELETLTGELVAGRDATGDGQISWQEGEGGLEHVEQHMGLMTSGEGLD